MTRMRKQVARNNPGILPILTQSLLDAQSENCSGGL